MLEKQQSATINSAIEPEEWRSVIGYDDLYEASNFGNIRVKNTQRLAKTHLATRSKYPMAYLKVRGKCIGVYVHRIICTTFHDNPDNKPFVDHINTNTQDNRAINLRWATAKENANNTNTKHHSSLSQLKSYEEHPERRQQLRDIVHKQWQSPTTKFKASMSATRRWANQAECIAQRTRTTKYFSIPENRLKASQSAAKRMKKCQCVETGIIYPCYSIAGKATGISPANISRACRLHAIGKTNFAGGYHWTSA